MPRMMRALAAALLFAATAPALAGRPCVEVAPKPDAVGKALALGNQVQAVLEELNPPVALIARAGQNLDQYGLTYSHMAFVMRDHPNGRWSIVHVLNKCGTAESDLYVEGLGAFFLDDPYRLVAGIMLLPEPAASRLPAILAGTEARRMHGARYSMLAYPFSTMYQNSNGWLLETLARALEPENRVDTREAAQAYLKLRGYQPTELRIGTFTRLGGRMFRANIAFDDHPGELRWNDRIQTVTVESVFRLIEGQAPFAKCSQRACGGKLVTVELP